MRRMANYVPSKLRQVRDAAEKVLIVEELIRAGSISAAAKALGVGRRSLQYRIKYFQLQGWERSKTNELRAKAAKGGA